MAQEFEIQPSPRGFSKSLDARVPGYAENLWTPSLEFGGGSTGITYSNQVGNYTKIGRSVVLNFVVSLSNKGSSTGPVTIINIPFKLPDSGGGGRNAYGSLAWFDMGSSLVFAHPTIFANTQYIQIFGLTAAGVSLVILTNAHFGNFSQLAGTITYFTDR